MELDKKFHADVMVVTAKVCQASICMAEGTAMLLQMNADAREHITKGTDDCARELQIALKNLSRFMDQLDSLGTDMDDARNEALVFLCSVSAGQECV